MNKYVKPTISLLSAGTNTGATSSCTTSTPDAKEIMDMLITMGYDKDNAFAPFESCSEPVMIEDYCKFTSTIQIFFS